MLTSPVFEPLAESGGGGGGGRRGGGGGRKSGVMGRGGKHGRGSNPAALVSKHSNLPPFQSQRLNFPPNLLLQRLEDEAFGMGDDAAYRTHMLFSGGGGTDERCEILLRIIA